MTYKAAVFRGFFFDYETFYCIAEILFMLGNNNIL
jgi:hypothetical protein